MIKKQLFKFNCVKCGSSKLLLEQYVRRTAPTLVHDDALEYLEPTIHDNDTLDGYDGYQCADCGARIYDCGHDISNEYDLINLLRIPPDIRAQQEKAWEHEQMIEARQEAHMESEPVDMYLED
jgi:hypothetical protein